MDNSKKKKLDLFLVILAKIPHHFKNNSKTRISRKGTGFINGFTIQ